VSGSGAGLGLAEGLLGMLLRGQVIGDGGATSQSK